MDFVNETQLASGWTMGFARDGRELFIVVVKATFTIPAAGEEPALAEQQVPLVEADLFTGEPGLSAPRRETDYAHHKPKCDVLVNGTAYAPPGKKVRQLTVGVRVGPMAKTFSIVGNRQWYRGAFDIAASDPVAFERMPISYDNAFGGVDDSAGDPANVKTFLENPVGRGYWHFRERSDGRPLPNTEEINQQVRDPSGSYRPMSFGAIGRNWLPRVSHAGTYDDQWLNTRAPFWPDDFDYHYFQAAPPEQQIPYPTGGEEVILKNLTPEGHVEFRLPTNPMPIWFLPHRGADRRIDANVDTIVIEPDQQVFTLSWRAALSMRRSCFDIKQIIAGDMPEGWQRARKFGNKPYYKGLDELARARRRR
jgi:hypothetical protein